MLMCGFQYITLEICVHLNWCREGDAMFAVHAIVLVGFPVLLWLMPYLGRMQFSRIWVTTMSANMGLELNTLSILSLLQTRRKSCWKRSWNCTRLTGTWNKLSIDISSDRYVTSILLTTQASWSMAWIRESKLESKGELFAKHFNAIVRLSANCLSSWAWKTLHNSVLL